jgi:hypothetical protein
MKVTASSTWTVTRTVFSPPIYISLKRAIFYKLNPSCNVTVLVLSNSHFLLHIFCSLFLLVQTGLTSPCHSSNSIILVADKGKFLLLYFLFYTPIPLLLLWMRVTTFPAIYLQPDCRLAPFTSTLKMKTIHSFKMLRFAYKNYIASQLRRPQPSSNPQQFDVTSTCRA